MLVIFHFNRGTKSSESEAREVQTLPRKGDYVRFHYVSWSVGRVVHELGDAGVEVVCELYKEP